MLNTAPARNVGTSSRLDFIDKTLAIKDPPDFTVISTFSGCGGSSTGYVWAGGKVLLAVEWDDNAVETYRLNYPDTPVYHGDIAKLSVDECLKLTGLKPGELDILDGSPPCQGFSTAGKRVMDDPRNQLFREYVRLLRGLQPKVFIMENVSGMVKGKMKLVFVEILKELKASGYQVSARLLNAMYFGVPQSRERMIFIGVRDDLGIAPTHPKAQTKGITPREAFIGIAENIDDRPFPDWLREAAKLIDAGNYNYRSVERAFMHVKQSKAGSMNTKLLSWDRTSCTLTKSEIASTGIIHPSRERFLTIPEAKRIGGFPDTFQFIGKREHRWMRIGNSVPPRFMQAIAEHVRDTILKSTGLTPELQA